MEPIICFGQQPSGFFPKRFLIAKINTAKKLQQQLGGRVVFFYHDSDADYRETVTLMRDRVSGADVRLNFLQPNKIQKKFSPLYAKFIVNGWKQEMLKQLPRFASKNLVDIFSSVNESLSAADFCLKMYDKMGLLEGVEVLKSSNKDFRENALNLDKNYFADVKYQGEVVRAERYENHFRLHEGGGKYIELADEPVKKWQKSAGRDQRFAWMNSVINCTHYIYGEGEKDYLRFTDFPKVKFIERDKINDPGYAWIG